MPGYILKNNFTSGVFSPRLYSRTDFEKYSHACKTLTNFYPLPQGGITKRPGTRYIASTKTAADKVELVPFNYSTEDNYILEFGDQYIRFFRDQGVVSSIDSNTNLLLHCDGDDSSTTFTDSGATSHTVTANGGAIISTEQSKFGGAAAKFDGSSAYLSIPDHADWFMGAGAFTIDFWVRFNSLPTTGNAQYFFDQYVGVLTSVFFYLYNNAGTYELRFKIDDAGGDVELYKEWNTPVILLNR